MFVLINCFIFILFDNLVSSESSQIKFWLPNTNFENHLNWNKKHLPGKFDSIVFDGTYNLPIEFPANNTEACEIILPNNGEIVFSKDTSLNIGVDGTSACTDKDIFIRKQRSYWVDPNNWKCPGNNLATPDLERLPCHADTVWFPYDSTYSLYIPDVIAHEIYLNGKKFYQDTLNDFIRSEEGIKMFARDPNITSYTPDAPTVIMLSQDCEAELCVCSYRSQQDVDEDNVCHIIKQNCITPFCLQPILPYGSCCPICGAQLLFKQNEKFKLRNFNELIENNLKKIVDKKIDFHISKSFYDYVQVVLVEHGEYEGYVDEVAQDIVNSVNLNPSVGLTPHNILKAGLPYDPEATSSILSSLLVTFILTLAVVGAIYYHYYMGELNIILGRAQLDSAFVFQRFDNSNRDETGDSEPSIYEVRPRQPMKSFHNPMYDVPQEEVSTDPADIGAEGADAQSFQKLKELYEKQD